MGDGAALYAERLKRVMDAVELRRHLYRPPDRGGRRVEHESVCRYNAWRQYTPGNIAGADNGAQ